MGLQPPVLNGAENVEADGTESHKYENSDELVEESGVEARHNQGVARLERTAHAGHQLVASLGRPSGP